MSVQSPWGTNTPPHGWRFFQPQTGWNMPTPIAQTLTSATNLIIVHRRDNPAMVAQHKLSMDPAVVQDELITYNAMLNGVSTDPNPKTQPLRPIAQVVAALVAGAEQVAEGAAPVIEWLRGKRGAVSPMQSALRAAVCADCKKMGTGNWTRYFTIPASRAIRKELERRHDLKLETPYDHRLFICEACLCPMKLKVHTPIDIIAQHLKPTTRDKLDPKCWILSETK